MTLRRKTLMIISLALLSLVVILYGSSRLIVMSSFSDIERQSTQKNVARALNLLEDTITSLDTTVLDWASWDDTYAYIADRNPGYRDSNLTPSTFSGLRLNVVVILDEQGQIAFARGFDLTENRFSSLPEGLDQYLTEDSLLVNHLSPRHGFKGLLMLPGGPIMIASRPVTPSEGGGPTRGVLIMGRFLDQYEVQRMSEIIRLPLYFESYHDATLARQYGFIHDTPPYQQAMRIRVIDRHTIVGFALINDFFGDPALVLRVELPRNIYRQGELAVHYFLLSLIFLGLCFLFLTMQLLERLVLARLARVNATVNEIATSDDSSTRVSVDGDDELASLSQAINEMLEAQRQSRLDLQSGEERYRRIAEKLDTARQELFAIIEFLPDATFVIDRDKKVIAWNRAIEEMTGIPKKEMIGRGDHQYAIPFYGKRRPVLIDMVGEPFSEIAKRYERSEMRGQALYVESFAPVLGIYHSATASPLFDANGNLVGAIESIRDITEWKRSEERLKYLSHNDPLTGLRNRAYFEEEMHRIEREQYEQAAILVCDVDGLKLVNDTLGHDVGDELLVAAARIISHATDDNDTVARIGGDEFAILIPYADQAAIDRACEGIRGGVYQYNVAHPERHMSISSGFAIRQNTSVSMDDLFKEADSNMYREKLHRSTSARSAIVHILMKALEARDFITEGHTDRLENLVIRVALAMELPQRSITDLRLLARFHDIGKVGIPDRILFKPGPLTANETDEMRLHCEIGYRIAQSAPDLVPIADGILKHHAWWNGQGYPLNLRGEEIPLECRILAIADAYDAMTSDRPYRNALSHEEALEELRKCAGTQFDPSLVQQFMAVINSMPEW